MQNRTTSSICCPARSVTWNPISERARNADNTMGDIVRWIPQWHCETCHTGLRSELVIPDGSEQICSSWSTCMSCRNWFPPMHQMQGQRNAFMYIPLFLQVAGLLHEEAAEAWAWHALYGGEMQC